MMPLRRSPTAFNITGYRQAAVPCVLYRSGGEPEIAVVFPGGIEKGGAIGGSPARPDLHYTGRLLQDEGLAVLEVWWDFGSSPKDDLEGWLDDHIRSALEAASRDHELALLAGRSLGSWALARAVSSAGWQARPLPTIWLAPLLDQPPVLNALKELPSPAFIVGGSDDPMFRLEAVEALRGAGHDVHVIAGADHSLDIGDAAASARHLADVLDEMRAFLRRVRG